MLMTPVTFFPHRPDVTPEIYAYEDTNPQYSGLLKVGYTTVGVQQPTSSATKPPPCAKTAPPSPTTTYTTACAA